MANDLTVDKFNDLRSYINQDVLVKQFSNALPQWLSVDRFLRVCLTSILKNPALLECTRESICSALICCAQLGLEPILNLCHLVPYKNTKKIAGQFIKVTECAFQMGYKGYIELANRFDNVQVTAHVVYKQDIFDIKYGTHEDLIHVPRFISDDKIIGAYTVWKREGSERPNFSYMPWFDIEKRRDKSQAYKYAVKEKKNDSVWHLWPAEQCEKTVIKRHAIAREKLSVEFMKAIELDNVGENLGHNSHIGKYLSGVDNFEIEDKYSGTTGEGIDQKDEALTAQFNAKILDEDQGIVFAFVKKCAENNKQSEDAVKKAALENWEQFHAAYKRYETRQGTTKEQPKDKKDLISEFKELTTYDLAHFKNIKSKTSMEKFFKACPQERAVTFPENIYKIINEKHLAIFGAKEKPDDNFNKHFREFTKFDYEYFLKMTKEQFGGFMTVNHPKMDTFPQPIVFEIEKKAKAVGYELMPKISREGLTDKQQIIANAVEVFGQKLVDQACTECQVKKEIAELTDEECDNLTAMIEALAK